MSIRPNFLTILDSPASQHLSKPKIYYPYLNILRIHLTVILIEEDYVIQLDIPMHDVEPMDVAESAEDLAHYGSDGFLGVTMSFLDVFQQGAAFTIFSDDAVDIFVHVCLIYFDDIGVIQSLQ